MFAFVRLALMFLVVLTLIYVCMYFYLREGAKMRLERDWLHAGQPDEREDWIDARLEPKAQNIRRWLVGLVYVLPSTALSVFVYLTN
ncbi:MAG: hypothetical protein AAF825_11260 [Pseudomonadota bacterium]